VHMVLQPGKTKVEGGKRRAGGRKKQKIGGQEPFSAVRRKWLGSTLFQKKKKNERRRDPLQWSEGDVTGGTTGLAYAGKETGKVTKNEEGRGTVKKKGMGGTRKKFCWQVVNQGVLILQ